MVRKMLAILTAAAFVALGTATPAQALQPGWERGQVPTILGLPKCIATKSAVRIFGVKRTKPGAVCAVRVWPVVRGHDVVGFARANRAVDGWRLVGTLRNDFGEYVADIVRRPS